jgi:hypothetical protein
MNETKEQLENLFESFWEYYPRKVGKSLALKRWMKLKPDYLTVNNVILPSLREHCDLKQWQDKSYIPHASTWLNQKRFMDDISNEPKIKTYTPKETNGTTFREQYKARDNSSK